LELKVSKTYLKPFEVPHQPSPCWSRHDPDERGPDENKRFDVKKKVLKHFKEFNVMVVKRCN